MITQIKFYTATSLLVTCAFLALIFFPKTAHADDVSYENDDTLISVSLYAEWCGTCKHLDAIMDDIKPEFEDSSILFIYLDKTTDFDVKQSRKKAQILGIQNAINNYEGRTGLILLFDS